MQHKYAGIGDGIVLVVLAQTAKVQRPSRGTLDNPESGQDLKARGVAGT